MEAESNTLVIILLFSHLLIPFSLGLGLHANPLRSSTGSGCGPRTTVLCSTRQALETQDELLSPSAQNANIELDCLVRAKDNTTLVSLEGYISKRRALGSSLVFYDLVVSGSDEATTAPVQALLRRDFYTLERKVNDKEDDLVSSFKGYFKALQPGTHVRLVGHAGPSRNPGEALLFVHHAVFLKPNGNPQHMRNILQGLQNGQLPLLEFASTLQTDPASLLERVDSEDHNSLSREILSNIPDLLDPAQLMGSSNDAKIRLLPPVPSEFVQPPPGIVKADDDYGSLNEPMSVQNVLDTSSNSSSLEPVSVLAWVRNRRRFQHSVTVLEVVDEFKATNDDSINSDATDFSADWTRLKCVLHPDIMHETTSGIEKEKNNRENSDNDTQQRPVAIYSALLCAGARVLLNGFVTPLGEKASDDSVSILWVTKAEMVRSSWRPKSVRRLIELLTTGDIAIAEAANALQLDGGYNEAESMRNMDLTERQWRAAEISRRLQDGNSRVGKLTPEMKQVLTQSKIWRDAYPVMEASAVKCSSPSGPTEIANLRLKKSLPGSRWSRAKLPQLEWMIEQIKTVIASHPGKRPLTVIDVGGGEGNLATSIAETFGSDVRVRVVDICGRALNNGMMRARRRNVGNLKFDHGDASVSDMEGVDIVVALHACGVLSDVAIGHAVACGAAFVVCPCCFRSNPHLRVTKRISESVVERTNNSQRVTPTILVPVSEWLGIPQNDYENLTQIAELQGDIKLAGESIHAICALRARAAQKNFNALHEDGDQLQINIKTFPIGFSTRNFCIIGEVKRNSLDV